MKTKQNYNRIESKNILVVGDIMLDIYINGTVNRISPEAPVPILKKSGEYRTPGGAGNVAMNLISAGQNVTVATVTGNDSRGALVKKLLKKSGINGSLLLTGKCRTTVKTRFAAENNRQLLRLDEEESASFKEECIELLKKIICVIEKYDALIITDYAKGLINADFAQTLIAQANDNNIPIIVDVKGSDYRKYCNATVIKPNLKELAALTDMSVKTTEDIIKASSALRRKTRSKYVLTTCGADGMVLADSRGSEIIPGIKRTVYDVTGAGDTAAAYLAAFIANGYSVKDAAVISNYAAALQVGKPGTASVDLDEVFDLAKGYDDFAVKLIDKSHIQGIRKQYKNKKIVFTNGCFDILHIGHLRYLKEAAKLGDVLIVGLNSDSSVRNLKGKHRPVNPELERAEMLAEYPFVDKIIIFTEETPYELIRDLKPDVLVKGGDYRPEDVIGKDLVEKNGGRVCIIPYVEGKSSTAIISKTGNKEK